MSNIKGNSKEKKNVIYYSRDYRHLDVSAFWYIIQFVFILIPVVWLYLRSYSRISYFVADFSADMIHKITGNTTSILDTGYFKYFGGVSYVDMAGKHPSFTLSFFSLLISLFLIIVFSLQQNNRKPLMIFITIGLYIHACSSAYFLVFGYKFPYNIDSYSVLYMKQQIVVWLMIMIVYWISTSLITKMVVYRLLSFIALIITLFIFGIVRYILYMIILAKCSYLFMASLYFTFGVLFDFMVMVGVFAIFIRQASRKYNNKNGGGMWKWS